MIDRYSFVALATTDLERARTFWVDQLGFQITEEEAGQFVMLNAGGLRLCIDATEGVDPDHRGGTGSPAMLGFVVPSLIVTLLELARRGIRAKEPPSTGSRGLYVRLRDPDGRIIVLTEEPEPGTPRGLDVS